MPVSQVYVPNFFMSIYVLLNERNRKYDWGLEPTDLLYNTRIIYNFVENIASALQRSSNCVAREIILVYVKKCGKHNFGKVQVSGCKGMWYMWSVCSRSFKCDSY
jgi:hypothetical protein